jgi:hypothetical protein
VDEALHKAQFVDYILLDSGNPNLKTKELGGTGRTHMARTKTCPNCFEEHFVMFRVQYKPDKTWYFLCEACVLEVKPGNPNYRYGGTWKG